MATSLALATAGLTSTLSTNNDAAAQQVLIMFAHATGANPAATNQEKLDHVAAELAEYMIRIARERYIQENSVDLEAEALTNVHW